MKHITQLAVVWLALLLVTGAVSADKRAEREICAEYGRIVQHTKQNNIEGLLRMMTPFMYNRAWNGHEQTDGGNGNARTLRTYPVGQGAHHLYKMELQGKASM